MVKVLRQGLLIATLSIINSEGVTYIPGKGCGGSNGIKILSELPEDFDGDSTDLECTILEDGTRWHEYQASKPAWSYSEISDCTAACGGGTWTRTRTCKDKDGNNVEDDECGGGFTTQTFACNTHACDIVASLVPGDWSDCSQTCPGGSRTRDYVCRDEDGSQVDAKWCLPSYTESEPCGDCSSSCPPAPTLHYMDYRDDDELRHYEGIVLERSDCESGPSAPFNWWTSGVGNPAGPQVNIFDLGCTVNFKQFILRATKHWTWHDFRTKDFSIEVSDSPDSGWQLVFEDVLINAVPFNSCDIPYQTFDHSATGRYVRLTHKTSYAIGFGYKYIEFVLEP